MKPLGGKNPASGEPSGKAGAGEEQAAKKQAASKQAGSRFEPLPVAMKRVQQRTAAQKASAPTKDAARHEKSVETVEEDGVITKIVVTCSCGEVTEIECGYGEE